MATFWPPESPGFDTTGFSVEDSNEIASLQWSSDVRRNPSFLTGSSLRWESGRPVSMDDVRRLSSPTAAQGGERVREPITLFPRRTCIRKPWKVWCKTDRRSHRGFSGAIPRWRPDKKADVCIADIDTQVGVVQNANQRRTIGNDEARAWADERVSVSLQLKSPKTYELFFFHVARLGLRW